MACLLSVTAAVAHVSAAAARSDARRRSRPTLLIVGCGDVGLRVLRVVHGRWRVLALTSQPARRAELRAAGAVPLVGDLDDAVSLSRLAGVADLVLHLAPPPSSGATDPRTAALLRALTGGAKAGAPGIARRPNALVYVSTSGVYGDCGGAWVDETRRVAPATDRARRRVDAERRVRDWGRRSGVRVAVLRVPGIYAFDRAGGDPRERVARGSPLLAATDDVYTNHVHADDLAWACVAALRRAATQRVFNVCDDTAAKTGDHYDRVADLAGLPRPPRLPRAALADVLGPAAMSFLGESRRLVNSRLKRELRTRLRFPTVDAVFAAAR